MNLTGNTILITGGGSGIGLALAREFHQRGNQVIIAGRRQSALDAATATNPGMHSIALDTADPASITSAVSTLTRDFPTLNAVLNNAGIMRPEVLKQGETADAEAIVATNLLGPIRLTAALIPHFLQQPAATILNVSSGLAFVPLALTPTYCATKAAIHAYTQSLRYQLKDTAIKVIEIIPPWVATELMGEVPEDPRATCRSTPTLPRPCRFSRRTQKRIAYRTCCACATPRRATNSPSSRPSTTPCPPRTNPARNRKPSSLLPLRGERMPKIALTPHLRHNLSIQYSDNL